MIKIGNIEYSIDEETGLPFQIVTCSYHTYDAGWWTPPEGYEIYDTVQMGSNPEYHKVYEYDEKVIFGTLAMICAAIPGVSFVPAKDAA